ncbi:hypothetical protein Q8A67_001515 [Cirrhinus molitorella]|uniref:RING-type E3 ubiquitin transferase n=1 Tax=Cirrhinus molitorella TaxID=172907 RepID=A0AA88U7P9_9TELE|nr:hypothetical protein Q8A67_001515 [Cirrhinus molitorella]
MTSLQELLLETLDDLTSEKLKIFKWHLKTDGFAKVVDVEKANATTDAVDLMVARCGQEKAVNITLEILRKMKENNLAEQLQMQIQANNASPKGSEDSEKRLEKTLAAEPGRQRRESKAVKSCHSVFGRLLSSCWMMDISVNVTCAEIQISDGFEYRVNADRFTLLHQSDCEPLWFSQFTLDTIFRVRNETAATSNSDQLWWICPDLHFSSGFDLFLAFFRYRMHGACNKGNDCEFSHDLKNSKSDMNCTYYKQGKCTYGDKCRGRSSVSTRSLLFCRDLVRYKRHD